MHILSLPILTTLIAAAFSTAASNPVVANQSQVHLECEDSDYGKTFFSLDIDYDKSSVTESHETGGTKYVNPWPARITEASIEWVEKVWGSKGCCYDVTNMLSRYSGELVSHDERSTTATESRYKCRASEPKF